ncbi:MAG TPA: 4Fe-4S dicluster domain-containing protein [Alphaproteobacteria bacterium]|jgi:ferredoxin
MEIEGKRVLVCDCEGTMPLDGKVLARACKSAPDARGLATQLCGTELGRFIMALNEGKPLIVACTQEAPRFLEQKDDAKRETPLTFVNIRETAGWSEEAGDATPKIAALLRHAALEVTPAPVVSLKSEGVTLIYGKDQGAIDAARRLADTLNVTVLLQPGAEVLPPRVMDVPVVQGRVRGAKGHLGAFELIVDDYATPAPSSRLSLAFGTPKNGARSRCDIVLDLTGGTPLFTAHETRDGYLRPDPGSARAVEEAIAKAADLVGEFDKPRYALFEAEFCAHSRSKKTGCTRCLDVCVPGAITPAGDHVAIDPFVCAGCGSCAAVCPTGAATYSLPRVADLLNRLRVLLEAYRDANGRNPVLLVHDLRHGEKLIDLAARVGRGLPARVIPFAVNEITQLGLEFFAAAIAMGAAAIRILAPAKAKYERAALAQQMGYAETVLAGLGYGAGRIGLIETDDPDALATALYVALPLAAPKSAAFLPLGDKRGLARLALSTLHAAAPAPVDVLAMPKGASFGTLDVKVSGCTLCLACVSACPTGALKDNPDKPMLRFDEAACIQCGLCKNTCPETVIALVPRLDFKAQSRGTVTIKEEEPAHCVRCGKAFGTKSSIDAIVKKLEGQHWMFTDPALVERLKMCGDCRVIVQTESKLDPYAGAPRPHPRTTDEYEAAHDLPPRDKKKPN